VIIVGATPAGIAAASKLGELGIPVILVDPDPDLDRKLAHDAWRLPSGLPFNFAYRPGLIRILRNPGIRSILPARVLSLKHTPQGFRASIQTSRTYIDPERCVLCGRCVEVCPVSLPDGGKPIRFFGRRALPGGPIIDKGRQPLCQANCPLRSMWFEGTMSSPESVEGSAPTPARRPADGVNWMNPLPSGISSVLWQTTRGTIRRKGGGQVPMNRLISTCLRERKGSP
jgi:ferredoxin